MPLREVVGRAESVSHLNRLQATGVNVGSFIGVNGNSHCCRVCTKTDSWCESISRCCSIIKSRRPCTGYAIERSGWQGRKCFSPEQIAATGVNVGSFIGVNGNSHCCGVVTKTGSWCESISRCCSIIKCRRPCTGYAIERSGWQGRKCFTAEHIAATWVNVGSFIGVNGNSHRCRVCTLTDSRCESISCCCRIIQCRRPCSGYAVERSGWQGRRVLLHCRLQGPR